MNGDAEHFNDRLTEARHKWHHIGVQVLAGEWDGGPPALLAGMAISLEIIEDDPVCQRASGYLKVRLLK